MLFTVNSRPWHSSQAHFTTEGEKKGSGKKKKKKKIVPSHETQLASTMFATSALLLLLAAQQQSADAQLIPGLPSTIIAGLTDFSVGAGITANVATALNLDKALSLASNAVVNVNANVRFLEFSAPIARMISLTFPLSSSLTKKKKKKKKKKNLNFYFFFFENS
jgi:hypothetical protein